MNKRGIIQGYVVLKHNGEVIYDDYNTITVRGREFILATLFKNIFIEKPERQGNTDLISIQKVGGEEIFSDAYKLAAVGFGYTRGDRVESSTELNLHRSYIFSLVDKNSKKVASKVDFESGFFKFSFSIKAENENVSVSELGLYLTPADIIDDTSIKNAINENRGILFSRISFDPIPMVPSTELALDYYLYV